MTKRARVDVSVEDEGSVVVLRLRTRAAERWVREHVEAESWQWLGHDLVVDWRFVGALVQGLVEDGLRVARAW